VNTSLQHCGSYTGYLCGNVSFADSGWRSLRSAERRVCTVPRQNSTSFGDDPTWLPVRVHGTSCRLVYVTLGYRWLLSMPTWRHTYFPQRLRPQHICDIYDLFAPDINVLTYLLTSSILLWPLPGSTLHDVPQIRPLADTVHSKHLFTYLLVWHWRLRVKGRDTCGAAAYQFALFAVYHVQDCEFNPKKPVMCERGCELVVSKDQLKVGFLHHFCTCPLQRYAQPKVHYFYLVGDKVADNFWAEN